MNKINPIFEALSGVDDRHIPAAAKKSLSKRLKIVLIAAAAAALALMVGFTTAAVRGRHVFGFYQEKTAGHAFDLKLSAHEITIPEQFMPQDSPHFTDSTDTPPGELFEMFGLTLPTNNNFTEIVSQKTAVDIGGLGDNIEVEFDYTLYNKTIGSEVYFSTRYFSKTDNLTYRSNLGLLPGEPSEVITLNDGSSCMVTGSIAVFSLDGAHCEFVLPYDYEIPENIGQLSDKKQHRIVGEMIEAMPGIDTVKQVLADLGVL